MTSLDEKFFDFCDISSSYKIGGVNDVYSQEQIEDFESEIQTNLTTDQKKALLDKKIGQANTINEELRKMQQEFETFDKKPKENSRPSDIIQNSFPIGKNDFVKPKLDKLNDSAKKFPDLCRVLFKELYDGKKDELESIFGSLADYPSIDPDSFGLMPINSLKELFDEYYLKYKVTGANPNFVKKRFYQDFLDKLGINREINSKGTSVEERLNNKIEYYKFNPDIWYNQDEEKMIGRDSYGYFAKTNPQPAGRGATVPAELFCFLKWSQDIENQINSQTTNVQKSTLRTQYENQIKGIMSVLFQSGRVNLDRIYNFDRPLYDFDAVQFTKSIDRFFQLNKDEKLRIHDNFLNNLKINRRTDFLSQIFPTTQINTFIIARYLFHFSNIYTTYAILLSHFFHNISTCYEIYIESIKNLNRKTKNTNNNTTYDAEELDEIQKRLKQFMNYIPNIQRMFDNILNSSIVSSNTGVTIPLESLFAGFRMDTLEAYNPITSYRIDEKQFKQILQTVFKIDRDIPLGGIPYILKENPKFNKLIIVCYAYFLKYRILSNKNYTELLQNYEKEIEQKVSLQDSKVISTIVDKKIEEIKEELQIIAPSEIYGPNYFKRCKKILEISINFVLNLSINTIKSLKIKNKKISQTLMNYKIGELKESIYQFMRKIAKEILHSQSLAIFHEFLLGYLLQYIYVFENYNKSKDERVFEKFEELLSMANKNRAVSIKQYSQSIADILTNDAARNYTQRRFFIGRKYEKLGKNAKKEVTKEVNPEIYSSFYWTNYEEKFVSKYNKKLFVIALEPVVSVVEKIAKVNVWLIDVFATAKSFSKPITRDYIKTIEEVNSEYRVTKERYSNDNNMILLNPFLRTIKEFAGWMQKVTSRGDWSTKKLHSFEFGHLLGKFLGIRTKKSTKKNGNPSATIKGKGFTKAEDYGYTRAEVMRLLINGQLLAYTEEGNKDTKIDIGLLMGYNKKQLDSILQEYYTQVVKKSGAMSKWKKYRTDMENKTYEDWQLYIIKKANYESIDAMREWTNNLLNSKPWIFVEDYSKANAKIVPLSNFSKMQAPFERYFIKAQAIHRSPFAKSLPDLLLHIYDMVYRKSFGGGSAPPNISKEENRFFSTETFFEFSLPKDNENRLKNTANARRAAAVRLPEVRSNDSDNGSAPSHGRRRSFYPESPIGSLTSSINSREQSRQRVSQYFEFTENPNSRVASSFRFNPSETQQLQILQRDSEAQKQQMQRHYDQKLQQMQRQLAQQDGLSHQQMQQQLQIQRQQLEQQFRQHYQQLQLEQQQQFEKILREHQAKTSQEMQALEQQLLQSEIQRRGNNNQRTQNLERRLQELREEQAAFQAFQQSQQQLQQVPTYLQNTQPQSRRQLANTYSFSGTQARPSSPQQPTGFRQGVRLEEQAVQESDEIQKLKRNANVEIKSIQNTYSKAFSAASMNMNQQRKLSEGQTRNIQMVRNKLEQNIQTKKQRASAAQSQVRPPPPHLQKNTQIIQLKAIIEENFSDIFQQNQFECQFTISGEIYTVNLQKNTIIISYNTNVGNSLVITERINENDNLFYAEFQDFYILFDKRNKIIKKQLKSHDYIMELNIDYNFQNSRFIWNTNFTTLFQSVVQKKEYEGVMNAMFPHKQYTSGFNLYTGPNNWYLLIIKGGNVQHSVDIISIVFHDNQINLYINPQFHQQFGKIDNFLYAISGDDTYIIDLNSNKIFKKNRQILYRLIWSRQNFYNWDSIASGNSNIKNVNRYVSLIQQQEQQQKQGAAVIGIRENQITGQEQNFPVHIVNST